MGKLTTHVLDLSAGTPAVDMAIELQELSTDGRTTVLAQLRTNHDGRCERPLLEGEALRVGRYQLIFHVADYYRSMGRSVGQSSDAPLPEPPFLDDVVVRFGIASPEQNYHVPLLVSPWSYSTYRGS